ncbi:hypothetical protein ACFU9Y_27050 [Streptomyces sp. NPDC057621]|uniref:hypothetical protein n=1 Tax=Streptomyces sp. NPDC057621 TaxID=3346186 RepID=UPI00369A3101
MSAVDSGHLDMDEELTKHLHLMIKTVGRSKGAQGFVILPRRWVVERSLAWWLHAHRNVRGDETRPERSEAMLTFA